MAENRNAQQVREITDKLEQGIKELFESERFKELILSILVDTFFSRISLTMLPVPNSHNTSCVLS